MNPMIAVVQGKLGRFTSFESSMDKLRAYTVRETGRYHRGHRATGLNPARGRNQAVEALLADHECDAIVFFDDDQVFLSDTLLRLTTMLERWDIAAPLILKTEPPFQSVAWQYVGGRLVPFVPWGMRGEHEMDEVGTGILAVRRAVFERLEPPWFRLGQIPGFPDEMMEDVYFCRSARAAGFRIGLDVEYGAGHTGPFTVWPDVEHDCAVLGGGPGVTMAIPSSLLGHVPEKQPASVGL